MLWIKNCLEQNYQNLDAIKDTIKHKFIDVFYGFCTIFDGGSYFEIKEMEAYGRSQQF